MMKSKYDPTGPASESGGPASWEASLKRPPDVHRLADAFHLPGKRETGPWLQPAEQIARRVHEVQIILDPGLETTDHTEDTDE